MVHELRSAFAKRDGLLFVQDYWKECLFVYTKKLLLLLLLLLLLILVHKMNVKRLDIQSVCKNIEDVLSNSTQKSMRPPLSLLKKFL